MIPMVTAVLQDIVQQCSTFSEYKESYFEKPFGVLEASDILVSVKRDNNACLWQKTLHTNVNMTYHLLICVSLTTFPLIFSKSTFKGDIGGCRL